MKQFFFCIFSFLLFFSTILFAQSITWQRILNNYNGGIKKVQQTYDGGYIAVGTDRINGENKIYLAKLDYLGNTLWTKIIGVGYTEGNWVEETSDRGFIIGGSTDSGTTDHDAYLVKTDSLGKIQWQKTYSNSDLDQCYCVKQTPEGGFILSCRIFPYVVGTWFIKTDNFGNIIWQKTFYNINYHIIAYREIENLDNGYIVIGSIVDLTPQLQGDVYIMRLNLNGDTIWTKRYGGNGTDIGYSIDKIENKGFILGGISSSFNPNHNESYLIKTDTNGSIIWQKTYSNNYLEYSESCYSVVYKQNTGFVLAGESDTVGNNMTNAIIRIVDTSGNLLMQKLFYPGTRGGWFLNIDKANDGGLILGGVSSSNNITNMYIVKTDSLLEANPIGIINGSKIIPENFILYQNYPNPFNSQTKITLEIKSNANIKILIYDISGKLIESLVNSNLNIGVHNFIFSTENLRISSAVYFYSLYIDNSNIPIITRKLIYLK